MNPDMNPQQNPQRNPQRNPIDELDAINIRFRDLLAAPEAAAFVPFHRLDDLLVWFLLGGKDVGKSTFLNALLGTPVSVEPMEEAEGTRTFVAYIHASARPELEARLDGLPVDVRFHVHESDAHRGLCLIDSPDFDSRFERHVAQVRQVMGAGVADGAVLLASPAKYKDLKYWSAFESLSGALSPRHILFALTKADELGGYLEAVRDDFGRTIERRMGTWPGAGEGEILHGRDSRVFLINSLERTLDFPRLETRLLTKHSAGEVQDTQEENLRHTLAQGAEKIRDHYRLAEVREAIGEAVAPDGVDDCMADLLDDHFPGVFFDTVASRLRGHKGLASTIRKRMLDTSGRTLAGLPTILSAFRWIETRAPFRLGSGDARGGDGTEVPRLAPLLRWGQEELTARLAAAREDAVSGLRLDRREALEPFLSQEADLEGDLTRLLQDQMADPGGKVFSRPFLLLLNLPVLIYLLLFISLVFFPVFLVLQAWGLVDAPGVSRALTPSNVEVSVIGFAGYYLMASLYVIRKYREQARLELEALARRFTEGMQEILREALVRPLADFARALDRLEDRLHRCTGPARR